MESTIRRKLSGSLKGMMKSSSNGLKKLQDQKLANDYDVLLDLR